MIRGLYTAAAGMVTQQRRHDTATQNIANLNTTGYKQVNTVTHAFPDVLISAMSGGTTKQVGRLNTGVFAEQAVSQYLQGDLIESGKPFDFALSADLRIQDPATGADMLFDGSGKNVSEDGEVTYQPQAFLLYRIMKAIIYIQETAVLLLMQRAKFLAPEVSKCWMLQAIRLF